MGRQNIALLWRQRQGEYIRRARIERGLTQQDVADAMGWRNKQMLSAIETGRVNLPPESIGHMADVLHANRVEFARTMLRCQNPWLYAALFGADAELAKELNITPERINTRRGPHATPETRHR